LLISIVSTQDNSVDTLKSSATSKDLTCLKISTLNDSHKTVMHGAPVKSSVEMHQCLSTNGTSMVCHYHDKPKNWLWDQLLLTTETVPSYKV